MSSFERIITHEVSRSIENVSLREIQETDKNPPILLSWQGNHMPFGT